MVASNNLLILIYMTTHAKCKPGTRNGNVSKAVQSREQVELVTAQDSSPHVLDKSALYGGSQELRDASRRRRLRIRHLGSYSNS
jgi:hypothetical protein